MRVSLLAAVAISLLVTPAAGAQEVQQESIVSDTVEAWQTDPVYVDPEAGSALSDDEADALRERIVEADAGAVYVAVLPESAALETGGSVDQLTRDLFDAFGRGGTYVVLAGTELRAGSSEFASGVVPQLADEAVRANGGEGAAPVLMDLVDRLEQEAAGSGSGDGGGEFPGIGFFPLLLIGGGLLFFVISRRRTRMQEERLGRERLEEVREVALEDLVALGEDLRAVDLDVQMPDANPQAKRDYEHALSCYERATQDLDRARRPEDLATVTSALEEGRFAMTAARARLEGREPPERRPPCFFDPRHGPSVRDVEWAPPDGAPRPVPACAADAQRVEQGLEPLARQVNVHGEMVPYWNTPGYFGPWAGGYYGSFGGGLLGGMLLGTMLGGGMGFGSPFGWGMGGWGAGDEGDGGDFGGDFGGGDFGGGDFGGGDFGGGDFGGGDFGGGDFG